MKNHSKSYLLRPLQLAKQLLTNLLGVDLLYLEAITDVADQGSTGGDQLTSHEEQVLTTLQLKERTSKI